MASVIFVPANTRGGGEAPRPSGAQQTGRRQMQKPPAGADGQAADGERASHNHT